MADYLEQIGRNERTVVFPPDGLWQALATTTTDLDLLVTLGNKAYDRGRFQHAIWLHWQAAERGDTRALWALAMLRGQAGDTAGAKALLLQAAGRGDPEAMGELAEQEMAEQEMGVGHWRWEWGGLGVRAGDTGSAAHRRRQSGAPETAAEKVANRGYIHVLQALGNLRERAGNTAGAEALFQQAAERGDIGALWALAELRERAGDTAGAEAQYRHAVDRGDIGALWALADLWERAGDTARAGNLRKFGLTGSGETASSLDFKSPNAGMSG